MLQQAPMTATDYMLNAKDDIDRSFGEFYVRRNPGLVAAYMQVATSEFTNAVWCKMLYRRGTDIADSIAARGGEGSLGGSGACWKTTQ